LNSLSICEGKSLQKLEGNPPQEKNTQLALP
jgi:hypothetical protein